ncbi:MAG: hypothetical protein U0792_00025 [Gemmataceae bacterium]
MTFTDQFGNQYEESYWRLVQCNISVPDKSTFLVFYGYKDKAARDASKQPVAAKQYSIVGELFDTYYSRHLEPDGPNLAIMAYNYAEECLDARSEDGTMHSFFENATDV